MLFKSCFIDEKLGFHSDKYLVYKLIFGNAPWSYCLGVVTGYIIVILT